MTNTRIAIRRQSLWMVRKMARECHVSEAEAERALRELAARGHLRILPGRGPKGDDGFEAVLKEGSQ